MNTGKNLENVATKVAPLSSVLHDGAAEIKQTLGHMAHDGKGAIGQMVHDGKGAIGQMVHDGKSRIDQLVEDGQERVGDWKTRLGTTVRERPIQSLLIVAGIGAVLGMLLRRRNA